MKQPFGLSGTGTLLGSALEAGFVLEFPWLANHRPAAGSSGRGACGERGELKARGTVARSRSSNVRFRKLREA